MGRFDADGNEGVDEEEIEQMTGNLRVQYVINEATKPFNPDLLPSTFMYVNVSGAVNSGTVETS